MAKITILFDLDGTLIDSTDAIVQAFGIACAAHNKKTPTKETITGLIGHPLDIMFRSIGIHEHAIDSYVRAYKEHYRTIHTKMTTLLPGAHEAITHASTIAQVAAVTTKTGRYSTELLEHFNLMQYFKALIGREDVTHPKPHPEPIQTALAKLKDAKPDHTYMIGDTTMDLLSAQAAGVHAVAVTCGYGRKEELAHYAKLIEPSALEAVKRIQKLYDRGAYQP